VNRPIRNFESDSGTAEPHESIMMLVWEEPL
jgi:hypothetical protein